jgi:hypothetical protein
LMPYTVSHTPSTTILRQLPRLPNITLHVLDHWNQLIFPSPHIPQLFAVARGSYPFLYTTRKFWTCSVDGLAIEIE